MKSKKIEFNYAPQKTKAFIPFHKVSVIDARADTSSIGFSDNSSYKLTLEEDFANTLSAYLTYNYNLNNDSANLLILIKEYRTTNFASPGNISDINVLNWKPGAIISAELFLNTRDNYQALYKIDSVLLATSASEAELIKESFIMLINKVKNKKLSELHIGKSIFSYSDLQNHINSFHSTPILNDSVLRKGVYVNFKEFKLNNPSIKNYEIHKGKLTDELFITEDNKTYPLQNFWGYCDGKNIFIYSANNLFKLVRKGNTFNVKAAKSLTIVDYSMISNAFSNALASSAFNKGNPVNANSSSHINYVVKSTAFQLNMQNGEIY